MPIEQLHKQSNDVFNYTFNRNSSLTTDLPKKYIEDPFYKLKNLEKRRENLHFTID